ncbi:hypothetical protein OAR19_00625, partial [bacterium]|nr:hypothetical protein [bacterium]
MAVNKTNLNLTSRQCKRVLSRKLRKRKRVDFEFKNGKTNIIINQGRPSQKQISEACQWIITRQQAGIKYDGIISNVELLNFLGVKVSLDSSGSIRKKEQLKKINFKISGITNTNLLFYADKKH